MALADRQRILARLATDAPLRDQLAADPGALATTLGLDPDDAAWLAALPRESLDGFAGSLVAKRRGEVGKLLPLTARALGPVAFAERFREYAARPIPDGPRRHVADAVAFAATVGLGPDDPSWLADLARLEASNLRAHHEPARRWIACRLGHRPADLGRAATGSGEIPPRRPTLVVWFRVRGRGRLRRVESICPKFPLNIRTETR